MAYREGVPELEAVGTGEPGPGTVWRAYRLVNPQTRGVWLGTVRAKNATEAKSEAEKLYQVTSEEIDVEMEDRS
jgi:hypothetical protein